MLRSHLVIAGSNFIFSHINENYGDFFLNRKIKLLVIFRGINTNYFNPQKISSLKIEKFVKKNNIDRNKFVILLPGRLASWKGQKIFIEALKLLLNKIMACLLKELFLVTTKEEVFTKNNLLL